MECNACPHNSHCKDKLQQYLETNGGRLTKERLTIMQAMCNRDTHFASEDIQHDLAAQGHSMALTTIYRNLPAFEKAGLIRRTTFVEEQQRGAATYEHVWGKPHHDHLICRRCGKKVEFHYEAIEVLQQEVARQHGFTLLAHHMELIGICAHCQSQSPTSGPIR